MRFTGLSLLAGKSSQYISAVFDSLYRPRFECFEVPENDRLAVFHAHQPGELLFDSIYHRGPRSEDYMAFHITTGKNRSPETKARFFRRLGDNLAKAPGVRSEDVMVVIAN